MSFFRKAKGVMFGWADVAAQMLTLNGTVKIANMNLAEKDKQKLEG